ncbi:MAG: hypothetical protein IJZ19_00605 [Lentisphaeria bacterium]|nr:hypothetical protein [Lentisphaeria bacterium]
MLPGQIYAVVFKDTVTLDEIRDFCWHETHFSWWVIPFAVPFVVQLKAEARQVKM